MKISLFVIVACLSVVAAEEATSCHFIKDDGKKVYLIDAVEKMRPERSDFSLYCECNKDSDVVCVGLQTDYKRTTVSTESSLQNAINPSVSFLEVPLGLGDTQVFFYCQKINSNEYYEKAEEICTDIVKEAREECNGQTLQNACNEQENTE